MFAVHLNADSKRVKPGCRKLQTINLPTLERGQRKSSVVIGLACPQNCPPIGTKFLYQYAFHWRTGGVLHDPRQRLHELNVGNLHNLILRADYDRQTKKHNNHDQAKGSNHLRSLHASAFEQID